MSKNLLLKKKHSYNLNVPSFGLHLNMRVKSVVCMSSTLALRTRAVRFYFLMLIRLICLSHVSKYQTQSKFTIVDNELYEIFNPDKDQNKTINLNFINIFNNDYLSKIKDLEKENKHTAFLTSLANSAYFIFIGMLIIGVLCIGLVFVGFFRWICAFSLVEQANDLVNRKWKQMLVKKRS